MTTIDTTKIAEITRIKDLPEPVVRGTWATWDQSGSRGVMVDRVAALRAAGYAAFFSAPDRRWGVKI